MSSVQIFFNGAVTKELFVQAYNFDGSTKKAKKKTLIVFLFSYLLTLLGIASQNEWKIDVSILFSSIVTLAFFGFVWWYVIERGERNNLNRTINGHGEGEITESSIIFRSNENSSAINWSEFIKYKKENEIVLLYDSPKSGLFTVFHKSFFKCENDWNSFVSLVEKNIG